ncbi:sulfite exporter TauE/SafE family protein [Qipengyuania pelagi]|uniref:Probable membrane transporter protein n=1 Tax=Qipengyuania pelagi TaxID=994320 RepID=A0A844Y9L7_9SPHN|nr:sulfite exporter TauE/SafE family protein [Qipengyuania pelagi]MEC7818616.1 sulfite exporter TauE/SafE family protein [Pseudomonadota bacterium]MXO54087.1 TSUP family transporter [Qipengyuania pelagi]
MDVYLPIANLSVNGLWIVLLGGVTGILSGLFGVGGGFLTTPLLIFYGVPPTVAAASASTQVTGASVSGVLAHSKRNGVDYRMGAVMVAGGAIGAGIGSLLFRFLRSIGQIDVVINALYVVLLGSIGTLMAREAWQAIRGDPGAAAPRRRRHHPLIASLPGRWRFYRSGLYISPLAPLLLGVIVGILTMLMGVGGGFILVPAMLYILGMSANVVVGTSLYNILFVTVVTTMMHSLTTRAVDIVLVGLLLIGSVTGAQMGTQVAARFAPEKLRIVLAAIVLIIALRMFFGLFVRPDEIYTVNML